MQNRDRPSAFGTKTPRDFKAEFAEIRQDVAVLLRRLEQLDDPTALEETAVGLATTPTPTPPVSPSPQTEALVSSPGLTISQPLWQRISRIRASLRLEPLLSCAAIELQQQFGADRVLLLKFQPPSGQSPPNSSLPSPSLPNSSLPNQRQATIVAEALQPGYPSAQVLQPDLSWCETYHPSPLLQIPPEGPNPVGPDPAETAPAPRLTNDSWPRFLSQLQVQSSLVLPLRCDNRLWGAICIHHCSHPHPWTALERETADYLNEHIGTALAHAQQLTKALDRAQLLQQELGIELHRRAETLTQQTQMLERAVAREKAVSGTIEKIRRSLNINEIFKTTVEEVRQLLQVDRACIYRFNADWSGEFVVESVAPGWTPLLDEQVRNSDLNRNVNECSIKLLAQPAQQDSYFKTNGGSLYSKTDLFRITSDIYNNGFSPCYIELLESLQARAYAIVAIYEGNRLWGLLAVYQNGGPRQWQPEELTFLVQISGQMGVAIQQAELFGQAQRRSWDLKTELERQLRQRAEELAREAERERTIAMVIDKIRRSLNIDSIFHTTATEVRQLLAADRVGMFRFFPDSGWTQGEFVSEDVLPGFNSAMAAQVEDHCFGERHATYYQLGRIWALDDIYQANLAPCHLQILERFQVRANLVVPLLKGDELWGLLCIHQCSAPRIWLDKDKEFTTRIAVQLGVALQQSELLSQAQRARDAADAANQAKSEFLANMSHELRTPLNAILGFAQVMIRDPQISLDQLEHLEIIGRSGEHLLSLINDVLEMSKIEAGQTTLNCTSFDLYRLLVSLQEMLDMKAESKGLQLIVDRPPEIPRYIRSDESKLRQVLLNLLGNAIKFTDCGSITLRIRFVTHSPTELIHPPQLIFEIEDTGPGIAPGELPHLFEAFAQTEAGRRSQEGTGLGLPISQKFARLMGGDIVVSSHLGIGSVFRCHIAIELADASEVPATAPRRRVIGLLPGQPTYRILIAEDKWANRQLLVKIFEPLGFEVREASNGQEAIDLWRDWQPHLIWMDMRMPVMDGYAATRAIKAESQAAKQSSLDPAHPENQPQDQSQNQNQTQSQNHNQNQDQLNGRTHYRTPPVILALTANAFEEERMVALAIGCDDFVRKPCQEELLLNKMAEHLGL